MSDFNHFEYVVNDKLNPSRKWQKPLMILGYIAVDVALFAVLVNINPFLIALLALTTWMMVYFTWRYLNVEYEYTIESGSLTFSKIYGSRKRKEIFTVKLKDVSKIAPLEEPYLTEADSYGAEVSYFGVPTLQMENVYFAFFEDDNKKRAIYYFQGVPEALKILKFYNSTSFPAGYQVPSANNSNRGE